MQEYILLANGIPSEDTFERVFSSVEPDALRACLDDYGKDVAGLLSEKQTKMQWPVLMQLVVNERLQNKYWHLDVTFREDASRARTKNAPENLTTFRKLALQIIAAQNDKLSLKKRRLLPEPMCKNRLFRKISLRSISCNSSTELYSAK